MEVRNVLISLIFIIPLVYLFVSEIIVSSIKDKQEYKRKVKQWNIEHPNLTRIKCMDCKYCKKETLFSGRYPNGYPHRVPVYCSYLRINVRRDSSCAVAEPTEELYQRKEEKHAYPSLDTKVYFSAYGDCYHSSENCPSIKGSQHLYHWTGSAFDRRPCPKCWKEKNGVLYPKNI